MEVVKKINELDAAAATSRSQADEVAIVIIPLKHTIVQMAMTEVKKFIASGKLPVTAESTGNSVILAGPPESLGPVRKKLEEMDAAGKEK